MFGSTPTGVIFCRGLTDRAKQSVSPSRMHEILAPVKFYRGTYEKKDNRQFKHKTLFATQTQTQRRSNLIMKANQMCIICHTPICH